jgi:methanethiol S-methyltransferase
MNTDMHIGDHILLATFWVLWCIVHSVLITNWWMRFIGRLPAGLRSWYRLLYVIFSIASLAPVLVFQFSIPTEVFWTWEWPWRLFQWIGLAAAGLLFFAGTRVYDQYTFFGLRQIMERGGQAPVSLRFDGVLSRVRHPYYGGGIVFLLFWGDGDSAGLIMRVVGIAYLIIGAELEERKLILQYGDEYREYRNNVPRFFPSLLRKSHK